MPESKVPETKVSPAAVGDRIASRRSEGFVKVYSNAARVEVTLWDFKVIFGELTTLDGKPIVEELASISMSPQHAKVLSALLARNLRDYEHNIGEIKIPEQSQRSKEKEADAGRTAEQKPH